MEFINKNIECLEHWCMLAFVCSFTLSILSFLLLFSCYFLRVLFIQPWTPYISPFSYFLTTPNQTLPLLYQNPRTQIFSMIRLFITLLLMHYGTWFPNCLGSCGLWQRVLKISSIAGSLEQKVGWTQKSYDLEQDPPLSQVAPLAWEECTDFWGTGEISAWS